MKMNVCEDSAAQLVRERELADALSRIIGIMNTPGNSGEVVPLILEEISKAIGSPAAGIALRENNQWVIGHEYNLPEGLDGRTFTDEEFADAVAAMKTRKPAIIVSTDGKGMPHVLNIPSLLLFPLLIRDQAIGCLFFNYVFSPDSCSEIEASFAGRAASLVSLALGSARILQEQRLLAALREEERARFDALLEEMPAGVIIVERSGRLIRANEQVARIWGRQVLERAEAGRFAYNGFHQDGRPYQSDEWPLARSLAKGELVTAEEIRIVRGDGTDGVISVSSGPIRDVRGRIIAGVMIFHDVTERKEAERSRRHLAAIVESSGQAVISLTKDENGIIKTWSRGAEKVYGYKPEEVIGRQASLLVPPGFPNDIPGIIEKIKRGEPVERHETMRMRKDGSLIPVSLTISPIRDAEGRIIGASTIALDISDRRRLEQALMESEIKFRKIASAAQDAVILVNNDGMVEFWNDAATKMFGFSSDEMNGKFLHSYIMPEQYRADFEKGFQTFTLTGEGRFIGRTYEITARRKEGAEFPVELSLAAMKLKDRWNAIGIVRDITERKRAEQELQRTLAELERSNAELQQFAYVASHDLQEPLRTVSSFVSLLGRKYKGRLDEKADKYITYAVEGAQRMSALINDLLAYSRVGTKADKFETVEMKSVFEQALANLRTAIRENEAVVTSDDLPVVDGDHMQLVQLLQNLIANAIKFKKKDSPPRIRISAERRGDDWVFGVHDNGIGIEPDYYEKVFEIFQRLHTRDEYPGTGVGLAVCKRIVERHGGRIWVESKPGEGSTFYFTLPARG